MSAGLVTCRCRTSPRHSVRPDAAERCRGAGHVRPLPGGGVVAELEELVAAHALARDARSAGSSVQIAFGGAIADFGDHPARTVVVAGFEAHAGAAIGS